MPINDPGNAGTASEPERLALAVALAAQQHQAAGQRWLTGSLGVITGAAIIVGSLGVMLTGEWRWLLAAFACWVGGVLMAAGLVTAVFGPRKRGNR